MVKAQEHVKAVHTRLERSHAVVYNKVQVCCEEGKKNTPGYNGISIKDRPSHRDLMKSTISRCLPCSAHISAFHFPVSDVIYLLI